MFEGDCLLVQETPDSGRPHKAVSPILQGEASIIQLTLNVGQEEVRPDSPPMLWMMLIIIVMMIRLMIMSYYYCRHDDSYSYKGTLVRLGCIEYLCVVLTQK